MVLEGSLVNKNNKLVVWNEVEGKEQQTEEEEERRAIPKHAERRERDGDNEGFFYAMLL